MPTIISIDPGLSTGFVIGCYTDETPLVLEKVYQVPNGVEGLINYTYRDFGPDYEDNDLVIQDPKDRGFAGLWSQPLDGNTILVEKFTARGGGNQGFSYRTKDLEALRVEGLIMSWSVPLTWVSPPQQYFLGGKDKAAKKKAQHQWLKDHGYYISPKSVGCPDADDARSATAHIISYLRRIKHKPTLDMFKGE